MGLKGKILSSIAFMSLAIVLTFVGVWALTDLDFIVGGNITYTAPEQVGDPVYITMGSYGGQDVQWKLIGVDGEHFAGGDMPTSGIGTFILETNLGITLYYDEGDIYDDPSNDYYSSDIRSYLLNEFVSSLSLSSNNIYKNITARTMTDLYTDIVWKCDSDGEILSISTTKADSDKLWLLSAKEIYTMLGGGEVLNNNLGKSSEEWSENIKQNILWGKDYWLRSPSSTKTSDLNLLCVDDAIVVYMCYPSDIELYEHGFRPAFNIDLSLL